MTDRTVSVILQAKITDYMAKMSAASKATTDFANKVDLAKGRTAQGFHTLGVLGVGMGTAVAGGYALAVKAAADFDARMALVRTLAHASASDMAQLRDAALHVGQAYGFSANQVADAEAELVKAGVSVADIMGGALTGALTLASAGQTDVATATTIAATAMTQFGLKGKDVPHIADLLASGADKALGSVVDLGYALDQAGPQAHQFGVSLEQTVGTLAAFAQSGQIGERGGTIFTQMLLKLAAPGKQASGILKQLGIDIYGANGQFVGMANLAGQLQSKMSGLTEAERNHDLAVIFGQRAIRGANILYQEGAQGIEDWTRKVNDSGFAALQSAGKMNSLAGDWRKFEVAIGAASVQAGQVAQGPLRTLVQDATGVIHVWSELPGPVRGGAEALILAGGAATLVGGATLLLIPKVQALNTALVDMSGGAVTARGALTGLGKAAGVALALTAVYEATSKLANLVGPVAPDVDLATASLRTFGVTGQATGAMAKAFGANLSDLGSQLKKVAAPSTFQSLEEWSRWNPVERIAGVGADLAAAKKNISSYDQGLATLVMTGDATAASKFWGQIESAAQRQGVSVGALVKIFPKYASALAQSKSSALEAGDGVDQFGNKVAAAGKKTVTAAQAAKKYSDTLHALADPLFAMNQALQSVVDAQAAATDAVKKYGANSPQARQANLDLASSALDAETAARTLAASVKNGSVSIGDARKFLKQWVADGLLTKQQADNVTGSFDHLIARAQTISGLHPHLKVTADTSQADSALSGLLSHVGQVINGFLTLGNVSGNDLGPSAGRRGGGFGAPVATPKNNNNNSPGMSPTSGYTPTSSDAGYYSPTPKGGSRSSTTRPPTVQEIVHAILTGTIPPSIEQLRKTLQTEIRNLSTTVGNAEQYRSQVQSSLLGYASLSNNNGTTDSFGSTMTVGVNAYLKGRLSQLKQFVTLRQRLERQGAGEGLLEEFDAIGPDANPMMRQLLAGGRHAVGKATRLEGRIQHLAKVEAGTATSDKYGGQIVALLERAPHEEARLIAKALAHQHIYVSLKEQDRKNGKKIRGHG